MERPDGLNGGFRAGQRGFPAAYLDATTSSFTDFLAMTAPHLLPGQRELPTNAIPVRAPHATTIVAVTYRDGVMMAGDRRATMGNLIAHRDVEKVVAADSHSLVGAAGTAGIARELVRLFQVELEHYEKIEGMSLTLEGKSNRLANMIRSNLGAAMQGLAVIPIFAGFDTDVAESAEAGRIYSYDVTGDRHQEVGYYGVGSGSVFAKTTLKKRWRADASDNDALYTVVEALYDAATEDSATGGPDVVRQLYPVVMTATADGVGRFTDDEVAAVAEQLIADQRAHPRN